MADNREEVRPACEEVAEEKDVAKMDDEADEDEPQVAVPGMEVVTESTIIATIHCPDVGYCLLRNPLVTHISYHVPSLLLWFPIGYCFP